jgi:hypothetical protein
MSQPAIRTGSPRNQVRGNGAGILPTNLRLVWTCALQNNPVNIFLLKSRGLPH